MMKLNKTLLLALGAAHAHASHKVIKSAVDVDITRSLLAKASTASVVKMPEAVASLFDQSAGNEVPVKQSSGPAGDFVVVQGLWLPPHLAGAKSAPNTTDALEKHGFHGQNAAAGLLWLKVAAHNKIYADRHSGHFQLYLYSGPYASKACFDVSQGRWLGANWCRVPALIDAMARFDARVYLYLDMDAFVNNFSLSPSAFLETTYLKMEYGCIDRRNLRDGKTLFGSSYKTPANGCCLNANPT